MLVDIGNRTQDSILVGLDLLIQRLLDGIDKFVGTCQTQLNPAVIRDDDK